jgi:hypothetical protein
MGKYTEEELSDEDILVSIGRAKGDLVTELPEKDPDWYSEQTYIEALFWESMLNTKIQSGALGSKGISSGDLDEEVLLAAADGEVTEWYRKSQKARSRLVTDRGGNRVVTSARTGRDGKRYYQQPDLE